MILSFRKFNNQWTNELEPSDNLNKQHMFLKQIKKQNEQFKFVNNHLHFYNYFYWTN